MRNTLALLIKSGTVRNHRGLLCQTQLPLEPALVLARRYLLLTLMDPHPSFDAVVNKFFALSLLVAISARPGDIGLIADDTPERARQI